MIGTDQQQQGPGAFVTDVTFEKGAEYTGGYLRPNEVPGAPGTCTRRGLARSRSYLCAARADRLTPKSPPHPPWSS